jgi:hypothetical protein
MSECHLLAPTSEASSQSSTHPILTLNSYFAPSQSILFNITRYNYLSKCSVCFLETKSQPMRKLKIHLRPLSLQTCKPLETTTRNAVFQTSLIISHRLIADHSRSCAQIHAHAYPKPQNVNVRTRHACSYFSFCLKPKAKAFNHPQPSTPVLVLRTHQPIRTPTHPPPNKSVPVVQISFLSVLCCYRYEYPCMLSMEINNNDSESSPSQASQRPSIS